MENGSGLRLLRTLGLVTASLALAEAAAYLTGRLAAPPWPAIARLAVLAPLFIVMLHLGHARPMARLRMELQRLARTADRLADQADRARRRAIDRTGRLRALRHREAVLAHALERFPACASIDAACAVVVDCACMLFPGSAGAVYVNDDPGPGLVQAMRWGAMSAGPDRFDPADCRALRLGRVQTFADLRAVRCRHLAAGVDRPSACIPLTARGAAQGMVTLIVAPGRRLVPLDGDAEWFARLLDWMLGDVRLRDMLRRNALHDPVTGLPGQRFLEECWTREADRAQRQGQAVGIVLLELEVSSGTPDADTLCAVGHALEVSLGADELACRLETGGIVVLLPGHAADALQRRLAALGNLAAAVALDHRDPCGGVQFRVATGWSTCPHDGRRLEDVLRVARRRLHCARDGPGRRSTRDPGRSVRY